MREAQERRDKKRDQKHKREEGEEKNTSNLQLLPVHEFLLQSERPR